MKGRPTNPCTNSYAKVRLRECVLNGDGKHVALCRLCTRNVFVRIRPKTIAEPVAVGVMPRHNVPGASVEARAA